MPVLSVLPPSISAAPIVAFPEPLSCIVIFWHTAVGGSESTIVTVAVQLSVLPLSSVTVRVTELAPRSADVKLLGTTTIDAIPQLSVLSSSTAAPEIVALPVPSRETVMFWQTAVGFILS